MGFIIMYSRDSKEFVGCDKRQAIYKSRRRADISRENFYNLNLWYDRRHHIYTCTHTQTCRRLDHQKEGEQMSTNDLAIHGVVGRSTQPSMLRGSRRKKYWYLRCGNGRCDVMQYGECGVVPKENVIANQ